MVVTSTHRNLISAALVHLVVGAAALSSACTAAAQSMPPVGMAPTADAQAEQADMRAQPEQADVPAPPNSRRAGLLGAIGQWFDNPIGTMTSGWNNARDAVSGLGNQASAAAKGAADVARGAAKAAIPTTSIVSGRMHCVRTATGGPDCLAATEALCRSKGYAGGTSLHIQSEQKCPVWGWIAGEKPVGKCGTETYVTSAMCR